MADGPVKAAAKTYAAAPNMLNATALLSAVAVAATDTATDAQTANIATLTLAVAQHLDKIPTL